MGIGNVLQISPLVLSVMLAHHSFSFHAAAFPSYASPASSSSNSVKIKWPHVHHKGCDLLIPTFLQVIPNLKFGLNNCDFREVCERNQTVSPTTESEKDSKYHC